MSPTKYIKRTMVSIGYYKMETEGNILCGPNDLWSECQEELTGRIRRLRTGIVENEF